MAEFTQNHGYQQGTYEGKLAAEGYNVGELVASGNYGKNINPNEYAQIQGSVQSPYQQQMGALTQNITGLNTQLGSLAGQQYGFEPNQFLPGIQQQASGIYDPQQAQLEAFRQLGNIQTQETIDLTNEAFEKQLDAEVSAINNRGAYFSGGAIDAETDIRTNQTRAVTQAGLQGQMANFQNLSQQGLLEAERSQFIQDRLYNAESSAYARWTDQRDFSFGALQTQFTNMVNERNFIRGVFESDRDANFQERQFSEQQRQFEQQYKITKDQFKMAKEEFNVDMKIKGLSYDSAMLNFKQKYAVDNSGFWGFDGATGKDIEQKIYDAYSQGANSVGLASTTENKGNPFFVINN